MKNTEELTQILNETSNGSKEAYDRVFPLVYEKMRHIASGRLRGERNGHTMTKTELVHEAYIKMIGQAGLPRKDRNHFFAIVSRCMRQILIDHARKLNADKRIGKKESITLIEELIKAEHQADNLLELDDALQRLAQLNPRLVEIVEYRYFGDMSIEDTAAVMNISVSTVKRDWAKARGWLYKELLQ